MSLRFIKEKVLQEIVKALLNTAAAAQIAADEKTERNVIDPFAALFQMAGFEMPHETWIQFEQMRQAEKTLQNSVGRFHQRVLGSMPGWEDLGTGAVVDLVNHERKILAEVKNKHNTVSGGKLADVYQDLEKLIMPKTSRYFGYTSYFVTIIPRKPERMDRPFIPSDRSRGEKCAQNAKIREMDGASFYDLVTGESGALRALYEELPDVISTCKQGTYKVPSREKLLAYFSAAFGK